MNVQTYLFFDETCLSAIELYQRAFNAVLVHITTYQDAPVPLQMSGKEHLVFHSTLRIGETLLNMSDDPAKENGEFGGFALLAHLDSVESVDLAFQVLASHGHVKLPPQSTFWATRYAVIADEFGVTWKLQFSS